MHYRHAIRKSTLFAAVVILWMLGSARLGEFKDVEQFIFGRQMVYRKYEANEDLIWDDDLRMFRFVSATSLESVLSRRDIYKEETRRDECHSEFLRKYADAVESLKADKNRCLNGRPYQFEIRMESCELYDFRAAKRAVEDGWHVRFQVDESVKVCMKHGFITWTLTAPEKWGALQCLEEVSKVYGVYHISEPDEGAGRTRNRDFHWTREEHQGIPVFDNEKAKNVMAGCSVSNASDTAYQKIEPTP
jgi:hypothetical protein